MTNTDIPIKRRYTRDVREGKFGGATQYWCPEWGIWESSPESRCIGSKDCGRVWSRQLEPGDGYRFLQLDEVIERGDEFFCQSKGLWFVSSEVGKTVQAALAGGFTSSPGPYRRKITQPQSGWIKCSERLPDVASNVWAVWTAGNVSLISGWRDILLHSVTHWMPAAIPALPEPEKSEAEKAFENWICRTAKPWTQDHKEGYLSGYKDGKGAK